MADAKFPHTNFQGGSHIWSEAPEDPKPRLPHVDVIPLLTKKLFHLEHCIVHWTTNSLHTRGVHSLLYFAYTCIQDLFIGEVIYLAKMIIR